MFQLNRKAFDHVNAPLSRFQRGRLPRPPRSEVKLEAAIVTLSAYQYPELVDLSQAGAKLRGDRLPATGASALLRAGPLEVLCRVVWSGNGHCGVRFEEKVPPAILKQVQLNGAVAIEIADAAKG